MSATDGNARGPGLPGGPTGTGTSPDRTLRPPRGLLRLIGIAAVLFSTLVFLFLAPGMVVIDVSEAGGSGVHLRVPAILAHLALRLVPAREWTTIGCSRGCARGIDRMAAVQGRTVGSLKPLASALGRLPDGTVLVSVDSPDESVLVEKDGGALRIRAISGRDRIRVEVPVSLVRSVLSRVRFSERDRIDPTLLPEGSAVERSDQFPAGGQGHSRGA